ncbi:PKD domain-containing protein [Methanofollis aquaemaris]|uniref:PKD domain-containing protein n=1 Tax=Methanofollis aquaemaris TaxID=126734 RepID=UPI002AD3388A|nr:PKD domain-containing protein [Methanofollis aquaemaris]
MLSLVLFSIVVVGMVSAAGDETKILPLGDSVTAGAIDEQSGVNYPSYRYHLWNLLNENGYEVNFVGTRPGPDFQLDFDKDNEGRPGWRTDHVAFGNAEYEPQNGNLSVWLDTLKTRGDTPDHVLIHLGTNDLLQQGYPKSPVKVANETVEDLRAVVGILREYNPRVTVYIAEIIPMKFSFYTQYVDAYNAEIPGLVESLDTSQSRVILVDQNSGFNVGTDLRDHLHPNHQGEKKMADRWYEVLSSALPRPSIPSADFTADPRNGKAPLKVRFTGSPGGTPPFEYAWDFNGDGVTDATGKDPEHTYSSPGRYTVSFKVTNEFGTAGEVKNEYVVVTGGQSEPYVARTVPCRVEAEEYDYGGEGVAYHDATRGNQGGAFRSDDVDIERWESIGVVNVGYTARGEWLEYTVDVSDAGNYLFSFRMTSDLEGQSLDLAVDGVRGATVRAPKNGWSGFTTVETPAAIALSEGRHVIRVTMGGGLNLDSFEITKVGPAAPVADFAANVTTGAPPLAVRFTSQVTGAGPLTYAWEFGDGGTSIAENPVHVYVEEGTYTVRLTATNSAGSDTVIHEGLIEVGHPAPLAGFTANVTSGEAPLSVQFTDTSRHATAWQWNFGDGGTSTGQDPAHTYTSPGIYTVKLTVTGPGGTASAQEEITVLAPGGGQTPFKTHALPCRIEAEDYDLGGEGVAYHDTEAGNQGNSDCRSDDVDLEEWNGAVTTSYAYPGEWLEYTVDIPEDGIYTAGFILATPQEGKECVLSVDGTEVGRVASRNTGSWGTYETVETEVDLPAGMHVLRLTFPQGWVNADAITFTKEGPAAPIADFSANVTSGEPPLVVQFTSDSTGTPPLTYSWEFGDGGTSTKENPVYLYATDGTYPVTLTVRNEAGEDTLVRDDLIVVGYQQPVASFTAAPSSGEAPLSVQFADTSFHATECAWTFGDGETSTEENPVHVYESPGTYTVTLTVTGPGGIASAEDEILVTGEDGQTPFKNHGLPGRIEAEDYDLGGEGVAYHDTEAGNQGNSDYRSDDVDLEGWNGAVTTSYAYPGEWLEYTVHIDEAGRYTAIFSLATPQNGKECILSVDGSDVARVTSPNTGGWGIYETVETEVDLPAGTHVLRLTFPQGWVNADAVTFTKEGPAAPVADFLANVTSGAPPLAVQFTSHCTGTPPLAYSWEFGDGETSTDPNPVHLYAEERTYTVTLTVQNEAGADTVVREDLVVVGYQQPVASFTADPTSGEVPLTVQFTDTSLHATECAWTFGDGDTSTDANPVHLYENPGTHTVSLTVTGPGGTASAEDEIIVTGEGGQTPFKDHALPGRIEAEDYDLGGEGVAYHDTQAGNQGNSDYRSDDVDLEGWNGAVTTSYAYPGEWLEYTVHIEEAGRYTAGFLLATPQNGKECVLSVDGTEVGRVTSPNTGGWGTYETVETEVDLPVGVHVLRLTFTQGWVNTDAVTFTKENLEAPVALFTAGYPYGDPPLTVRFWSDSTGTPPLTYAWDFGDGGTSDEENPEHVYVDEGYYSVRLTVENEVGENTTIRENYVHVGDARIVADFTCNVTSGEAPLAVQFTDTSDYPAGWRWYFGDGGTSTEQHPVHVYEIPGFYAVKLETSSGYYPASVIKEITVSPAGQAQHPFKNHTLPCRIEAEDYDLGGDYVAYYDAEPRNRGDSTYRSDDVDLGEMDGAVAIVDTNPLEWAEYTVEIPEAGEYMATFHMVPDDPDEYYIVKHCILSVDGSGAVQVPAMMAEPGETFHGVDAVVDLPEGRHVLRFAFPEGGVNLDAVTLTRRGTVEPPVADFEVKFLNVPTDPCTDAYSLVSTSTGTHPMTYFWDYGDGTTCTVDNPHTVFYDGEGAPDYQITLTVTNSAGSSEITKSLYHREPGLGEISFEANVTSGEAPLAVRFTGDPPAGAVSTYWWFGDGTPEIENQNELEHVFTDHGTYEVRFGARGTYGRGNSTTKMITVTTPEGQLPFKDRYLPPYTPSRIEAEDYDLGGEGVAYHDTDPGVNQGGAYREEGVDLTTWDKVTAISHTEPGEWVEYTLDIRESKNYKVIFDVATPQSGKECVLSVDGTEVGRVTAPNTGTWSAFEPVEIFVDLPEGKHILRVTFPQGEVNLDRIRFDRGDSTRPMGRATANVTSGEAPLTVQFTSNFTGTQPFSYSWDFGDGITSEEENPVHQFTRAGTYDVILTVENRYGSTPDVLQITAVAEDGQAPYKHHELPCCIEAEDFDVGGEGVAYHDSDPEVNQGGSYHRRTEGVDIDWWGESVYSIDPGEWLEYTVDIPVAGTYMTSFNLAALEDGKECILSMDGSEIVRIVCPNTGAEDSLEIVYGGEIELPAGRHVLRLTFPEGAGSIDAFYLTRGEDEPPVADFSAYTLHDDLSSIQFSNNCTGTFPRSYFWDFGDGEISTEPNPFHSYLGMPYGYYTVKLTVTNSAGSDTVAKTFLRGYSSIMKASKSAYPTSGDTPIEVRFIETTPVDENNETAILDAAFETNVTSGEAPLTVQFTDVIEGDVRAQAWDFGDGTSSLEPAPVHRYEEPGNYTVTFTVVGPGGASKVEGEIIVLPAGEKESEGSFFPQEKIVVLASSAGQTPFKDHALPGRIEAEDYDLGGEGVAYHDTETGNQGNSDYRSEDVDLEFWDGAITTSYAYPGEWLEYTVEIEEAGRYTAGFSLATPQAGKECILLVDGVVVGRVTAPNTGGWGTYETIETGVDLPAGTHVLRVVFPQGWVNADAVTFTKEGPAAPVADFSANITSGAPPLAVQFTSTSTGTPPLTYSWEFGDGENSTEENPIHLYATDGTYPVTLTVRNEAGEDTLVRDDLIVVGYQKPVASFTADPTSGEAPLSVQFTDTSLHATECAWTFGDGETSDEDHPVYVYEDTGIYTVTLTVTGPGGTASAEDEIVVTGEGGQTPFKDHTLPGRIEAEDYDLGGEGIAYHDTEVSNQGNSDYRSDDVDLEGWNGAVTTSYAFPGEWLEYTVRIDEAGRYMAGFLLATPQNGKECVLSVDGTEVGRVTSRNTGSWGTYEKVETSVDLPAGVHVLRLTFPQGWVNTDALTFTKEGPAAPVADFSANVTAGAPPLAVQFMSQCTGTPPLTYSWEFGDGGTSTEENPVHLYAGEGTYSVTLTVSNGAGEDMLVREDLIVVGYQQPVASFTADPTSGEAPLSVQFTDTSLHATECAWTFGDGEASDEDHPVHVYEDAGTYTVTLTVTGPGGTASTEDEIIVTGQGGQTPFKDHTLPGRIEVEDYDLGGEGIAYHDTEAGNQGNSDYRSDDVDLEGWNGAVTTSYAYPGEWLEYTVDIEETGRYTAGFLLATPQAGKECVLSVDGTAVRRVTSPNTGGWGTYEMVETSVDLPAGTHVLRLTFPQGWVNADAVIFTKEDLEAPVANFSATFISGHVPHTVCFTSHSTGTPPLTHTWDFGDGSTSEEENPRHRYVEEGHYSVRLTVQNAAGENTIIRENCVRVGNPRTIANFTRNITSGEAPLAVQFTDHSPHATAWRWYFGDGGTSTEQHPVHVFENPGVYVVKLEAKCGMFDEIALKEITVTPPGQARYPFKNHTLPCRIEAEDYDLGDECIAYYDAGPGNRGDSTYRSDDVDLGEMGGAVAIMDTAPLEWVEYTVNITEAGEYMATFHMVPDNPEEYGLVKHCTLSVDSAEAVKVPAMLADPGEAFRSVDAVVDLPAGQHVLRFAFPEGGVNLDAVTFTRGAAVEPPVADFEMKRLYEFGRTPGIAPYRLVSTSTGAHPMTYFWEFDDGSTSTEENPCHRFDYYSRPKISLTVTNSAGSSEVTKHLRETYLYDDRDLGAISFEANVTSGKAPLAVRFTGVPPEGTVSTSWNFGDGSPEIEDQNEMEHLFAEDGIYTVTFEAEGNYGYKNSTSQAITVTTPEGQAPFKIPSFPYLIEAEDYDLGGEGVAYHDADPEVNQGGAYREEGVDLTTWGKVTAISHTEPGEWVEYTLDIEKSKNYKITLEAATPQSGKECVISVDGAEVGRVTALNTGDWSAFEPVEIFVDLPEGTHVVRVTFPEGGVNLDSIHIPWYVGDPSPPSVETSANVTSGEAPLAVQFTSGVTGTQPFSYSWNFDDGTTSDEENPLHEFIRAGTYHVVLTVDSPYGLRTSGHEITVTGEGGQVPFKNHALPCRIEAEDYDLGGEGVAYHDTETGNQGNSDYRSDDVDLESWNGAVTTSYAYPGEWLEYTVEIEEAGTYTAALLLATPQAGKECVLSVDGTEVGRVTSPNTGGWGNYKTVETEVDLPAGTHVLRLTFPQGWVNADAVIFTKGGTAAPVADFSANVTSGEPPLAVQFTDTSLNANGWSWDFGDGEVSDEQHPFHLFGTSGVYEVWLTVDGSDGSTSKACTVITVFEPDQKPYRTHTLPCRIEAEDYDWGGEEVAYHDKNEGNQGNSTYRSDDVDLVEIDGVTAIGHTEPGEWVRYTVDVPEAGVYTAVFHAHALDHGARCTLHSPGSEDASVSVYRKLDDMIFQTFPDQFRIDSPGKQVLDLSFDEGEMFIDAITVLKGDVEAPRAEFEMNVTSGDLPLAVGFASRTTGTGPFSYAWDFGDGGSSDEENPTHIFTDAGVHIVTLTLTSHSLFSSSISKEIVVVSPDPVQEPYTNHTVPCRIEAEDFDLGGADVAYHDSDPGKNWGGAYRDEGVDLLERDGVIFIYAIYSGEWVEYTVDIPKAGRYRAAFMLGHDSVSGEKPVLLSVDGTEVGEVRMPKIYGGFRTADTMIDLPEGRHVLRLTFPDGGGRIDAFEITRGEAEPPTADFSASYLMDYLPGTQFSNNCTGTFPRSYFWDFGDGETSTDPNPSHSYYDLPYGYYTVKLTVTNSAGSDTVAKTFLKGDPNLVKASKSVDPTSGDTPIEVQFIETTPVDENNETTLLDAAFETNVTSGEAPLTVQFTDVIEGDVRAQAWDFGDGTSSLEPAPVHRYEEPGNYTVTFSVVGPGGASKAEGEIIVLPTEEKSDGRATYPVNQGKASKTRIQTVGDEGNRPFTFFSF